jgi:ATP phosphoribosyltransferase
MAQPIILALPKGRILEEALPLLAAIGVTPHESFHDKASRALKFATSRADLEIIRVRAFDVATFVAHGAAQIGIVGSDVIEEFGYSEIYAPIDLDIGHCRISVAVPQDYATQAQNIRASHVRVATKYPNLTHTYYANMGVQAECIKLNGAMELAPALGLTSHIVDLVSSGKTLQENGLVEKDVITHVSARLIVNRVAAKTRPEVEALVQQFSESRA